MLLLSSCLASESFWFVLFFQTLGCFPLISVSSFWNDWLVFICLWSLFHGLVCSLSPFFLYWVGWGRISNVSLCVCWGGDLLFCGGSVAARVASPSHKGHRCWSASQSSMLCRPSRVLAARPLMLFAIWRLLWVAHPPTFWGSDSCFMWGPFPVRALSRRAAFWVECLLDGSVDQAALASPPEPLRSPCERLWSFFLRHWEDALDLSAFPSPRLQGSCSGGAPLFGGDFPGGLGICGPGATQLSLFPPTTQPHSCWPCAVLHTCILWFVGNFLNQVLLKISSTSHCSSSSV